MPLKARLPGNYMVPSSACDAPDLKTFKIQIVRYRGSISKVSMPSFSSDSSSTDDISA